MARPQPSVLFGATLAVLLALVGLRAGGGLLIAPTVKVEMPSDILGGLLAGAAALAVGRGRAWGAVTVGLFAVLAGLTALSIVWAVQPSEAWLEGNRVLSYLAVFGAGVVLARLAGGWWSGLLAALIVATALICGYAVLTKVFPGWLAPGEKYARLEAPYGYWNAVGLTAALGVPPTLWLGARRSGHGAINALAYPVMGLLVLTILLAYSRGALLALVIGCAFWLAVVPLRLRSSAVLLGGGGGGVIVAIWAFAQATLSEDSVALGQRITSGHELGVAVAAMVLVTLALGLGVNFALAQRPPSLSTRRQLGAVLLIGLALIPVGAVGALALSNKGLTGTISSNWKSLTDPHDQTPLGNDPSRLTKLGSVRARYWNEALKIARDHPLKGVGAGGYRTARLRYRTDTLAVRHAHGYVVQTAANLGALGLAASAALLIAWLLAARRALGYGAGRVREFGPERVALASLTTVVLIFGAHSFIDWTWFVPGTAVMALLCAGWIAGRGPLTQPPADARALASTIREGARVPWRLALAALGVSAGILAAWTAWQPLRSVDAGNAALAATGPSPAAYAKARALAETSRSRNPLAIEPLVDLSYVETVAGHRARARHALEDAVRLQPSNPEAWEDLSRFVLNSYDDPKLALRLLGPAIYLDPHSTDARNIYLAASRRAQALADERQRRSLKRQLARRRAAAKHRKG